MGKKIDFYFFKNQKYFYSNSIFQFLKCKVEKCFSCLPELPVVKQIEAYYRC